MTGVKLKEQYISYLPLLQTLNNIPVIMLLRTFNIISLILDMCKGDYVITAIETSLYCIVYCREVTGQILLTRLHEYLDQVEILPVSQCGLRKARRPIGMILSARHFQQKYQKQNMDLNMTVVYSVKAFDSQP